ncbi:hypothetical protein L0128_14390 [candidate division KSB1 bacterium]|nr:hypothetical protein [candidate division KSB1 bacterium]
MNCQDLPFSPVIAQKRLENGIKIFGEKVIQRILGYALFLLGVNRHAIAKLLSVPVNTIKSNIRALAAVGIPAFEDRRQKSVSPLSTPPYLTSTLEMNTDDKTFILTKGADFKIQIPLKNKLQLRTFVLTLLDNGLIQTRAAATVLQLSTVQTQNLAHQLQIADVEGLRDHRQGQAEDYVFTPEVKAELIQQFTVACISHQKTSSSALAQQLKERCQLDLSARSIRYHLNKLGLVRLKKSLPQLLQTLKKNCC